MSLPSDISLTNAYTTNKRMAEDAAKFQAMQREHETKGIAESGYRAGQEDGMLKAVGALLAQAPQQGYTLQQQVDLGLITPEQATEARQYRQSALPMREPAYVPGPSGLAESQVPQGRVDNRLGVGPNETIVRDGAAY